MHELSVCLALMNQVNRIANEHDADRVEKIVLKIGPLSGIEAALLENAFPLASAGTVAEGAELVIDHSPVTVECTICGAVSEVAPNRLLCGACGDFRTRVVSGEDMTLVSLELATSNDRPSRHDPTAHAGTIDAAGPPS
jgi:hydrogenase nickel incorporation protein HypA/HybF